MEESRKLSKFAEWVMDNYPNARTEDLGFLLNDYGGRGAFGGAPAVKGRAELATVERLFATNDVLTAAEADEQFGKARNTTSTNCRRGCFPGARQSGSTWLIHVDDLSSFYGATERLPGKGYDNDPCENLDEMLANIRAKVVFDDSDDDPEDLGDGESTLAKIRNQQLRDDD